jgi:hypothetical protein
MAFLTRRRSSLVKVVLLLCAIWITIAFFIYTDDRQSIVQTPNVALPLKDLKNDFDEFIIESKRDAERGKSNKHVPKAPVAEEDEDLEERLQQEEEPPELEKNVNNKFKKVEKDTLDYKKKPYAKKKNPMKKLQEEENEDGRLL